MLKELFFVSCAILVTQVDGGTSQHVPVNVMEVVFELNVKSAQLQHQLKVAINSQKSVTKQAKQDVKLALKTLKTAIKLDKTSACGITAQFQLSSLEKQSDNLKFCTNEAASKEAQRNLQQKREHLYGALYFSNSFCCIHYQDDDEITACVDRSVAETRNQLEQLEITTQEAIAHINTTVQQCVQNIVHNVQTQSEKIKSELEYCMNPTTAAPSEEDCDDGESVGNESGDSEQEDSDYDDDDAESGSGGNDSDENSNATDDCIPEATSIPVSDTTAIIPTDENKTDPEEDCNEETSSTRVSETTVIISTTMVIPTDENKTEPEDDCNDDESSTVPVESATQNSAQSDCDDDENPGQSPGQTPGQGD